MKYIPESSSKGFFCILFISTKGGDGGWGLQEETSRIQISCYRILLYTLSESLNLAIFFPVLKRF
jgi:hypothetical protein